MPSERDDDLLASITDGAPADWDGAERAANEQERPRLAVLRGLSRMAEFHRQLQHEADDRSGPARWGELTLLECVGASRGAEVWRAWEPSLEREVALKLLRAGHDESALLEEGRCLARVRHPNVVSVLGVDRHDGRVGLWMELVRGATLEQLVRAQGPLPVEDARRLGLEIGAALAAVHAQGLVHRDLKPANVFRDLAGRFVLADFGLGLRPGGATPPEAGRLSGTPMYMAPELFAAAPAGEKTDLYSLGMLVWFALTGAHPFEAQSLAELVAAARVGPRPALRERRADVPTAIAAAVERAIAPDPAHRFGTASEWVAAMEAAPAHEPRASRRGLVGALLAIALLTGGVFAWRATHRAAPGASTPATVAPAPAAAVTGYTVEASFLRRDGDVVSRLVSGDRVRPGDHLALDVRTSRPAWIYVLDEDEQGERYVLFPQPRLDRRNPLPADSSLVLPGTLEGREFAWTVTSAGGREYVMVIASPEPIAEIEADLARMPRAEPRERIRYAPLGSATLEHLRGIGAMVPESPAPIAKTPRSPAFDRFRALAGRESGVHGVWIRQIVLENPGRR